MFVWSSQERVRYADGNAELLIGSNEAAAAKALLYSYDSWNYNAKTPQQTAFIAWLKSHLDAGQPVISGLYERQKKSVGDPD